MSFRLHVSLLAITIAFTFLSAVRSEQVTYNASAQEADLLAVLAGDSEPADKAIACKQLAIQGSSKAVGELEKLLSDEKLASWSRIALEAISGDASAKALRNAAQRLEGNLKIGAINSLGAIEDELATDLLSDLLNDDDEQVVAAAAAALGNVGGPKAGNAIVARLVKASDKLASSIAVGGISCADKMLMNGQNAEALKIYQAIQKSKASKQHQLESIRGEILAKGVAGIPLLREQLNESDSDRFRLALSTARESDSEEVDQALSKELMSLSPERSALVLLVLADRNSSINLPVILQAAKKGPVVVRIAAIESLGEMGNATCLKTLFEIVKGDNANLSAVAEKAIAKLPGSKVNASLLQSLKSANEAELPLLLNALGQRRVPAVDIVSEYLSHPSQAIRRASLYTLGQTIEPENLSLLINQVTSNQATVNEAAEEALLTASVRMPDREACASELTEAFENATSQEAKVALLKTIGEVGGEKALDTIYRAAQQDNATLTDVSTQLLGEWMDANAAPILLDLFKKLPEGNYQTRVLRAYLRIARQLQMPEAQRTAMCRQAFLVANRVQEKELAITVLGIHPNQANLELALEIAKEPELADMASEVAVSIAQHLAKEDK